MKNFSYNLFYKIRGLFSNNTLNLYWFKKNNNFGDILNVYLIEKLTNKKVNFVKIKYCKIEHFLCIGSLLASTRKNTIVWGAGFMDQRSKCFEKPKKIYAVRGPKTRKILLENNIDCPEVYGDPALLLPRVYNPKIKKCYKYGIIPHYVDADNPFLEKIENRKDVLIIDILNENPFNTVDEILSCENIISSSLHGIIVADAYNIPSLWIEFSDKVIGSGFKFYDYFESVKKNVSSSFRIDAKTEFIELIENINSEKIDIDLDKLIKSCPFDIKYLNY
ncbi:polysaccharide pyruvyl transferase family protein [Poseidonibacter ostreae]|nr:polysaccharide pyruvyl transferase family protein [Poseidonibacter ostreae]